MNSFLPPEISVVELTPMGNVIIGSSSFTTPGFPD